MDGGVTPFGTGHPRWSDVCVGVFASTFDLDCEEVTMIVRRIARPMLAAVFVSGGLDTLRNPKPRAATAAPAIEKMVARVKDRIPDQVPTDAETIVKANAATQVGAGIALGLGICPRLAALVLAGSLAPTTLAGHPFWEHEEPVSRAGQRVHFLKNVSIIGGLLMVATDARSKQP